MAGCLPSWIDDEECDELCHNEACGWDGIDCNHGADDCYEEPNGTDYRGMLAQTVSGRTCQMWSHQTPHAHTHVHMNYPHAGLGGHNHCRNPGTMAAGPWCYTMDPAVPWELCAVPERGAPCSAKASMSGEAGTLRYHILCPIDCEAVLGNGQCDLRCNLTSCAYDAGDCGVGLDVAALLADQGLEAVTPRSLYLLVGLGVLVGMAIGLCVLRLVLLHLKREELRRRGYTKEEMKGMDAYDPDEA